MNKKRSKFDFSDGADTAPLRIRMAPLIDIVFLLICFFMMASQMIREQDDPTVDLPEMSNQQLIAERPTEVVINLTVDGVVNVNRTTIKLENLPAYLDSQRREKSGQGEKIHVVIRPDRRQDFGRLSELLEACRDAGFKEISFRAERENQK